MDAQAERLEGDAACQQGPCRADPGQKCSFVSEAETGIGFCPLAENYLGKASQVSQRCRLSLQG